MLDLQVTKYSHFYTVFAPTAKGKQFRREFAEQFIETGLTKKRGRFVKEQKKIYAWRDVEKELIHFHINTLNDFRRQAQSYVYGAATIEEITAPMYTPAKVEFRSNIELWENQVAPAEFCIEDGAQKIVTAQAGSGKTLISLKVASVLGVRFATITQGGYEDRWVPEYYDKLGLTPKEVRSCCGCVKLYRLLREVRETGIPDVKAIFISTTTLYDFMKNYVTGKTLGTGCEDIHPTELWELLGVGLVIVDEVHKSIHQNFRTDLITHVPKVIYLSATLFPNTDFMAKIYETMLPKHLRRTAGEIKIYVDLKKVVYNLHDWRKAVTTGGQGSYSHVAFEEWIMKDPRRENNYYQAIFNHAQENWYLTRQPQHKLLIFFARIEMCQRMVEFFRKQWPQLVINSYTSGDDYQILLDSDLIISTLGKSGTAVDIPDLTQAYLTPALDSANLNIQALGRLRELKGEKAFPQSYHCFVCANIDKHIDYWHSKEKLFKGRVKSTTTLHLDRII